MRRETDEESPGSEAFSVSRLPEKSYQVIPSDLAQRELYKDKINSVACHDMCGGRSTSMKSILRIFISTYFSVLAIANQVPAACLPKSGYSVRCVREFSYQDGEGFSKVNHTLPDMENSTAGNTLHLYHLIV